MNKEIDFLTTNEHSRISNFFAEKSDLLKIHNNKEYDNEKELRVNPIRHGYLTDVDFMSKSLAGGIVASGTAVLASAMSFGYYSLIGAAEFAASMNFSYLVCALGGGTLGLAISYFSTQSFMARKLKSYAKSNNPRKRNAYVNMVFEFILVNKYTESPLLRNPLLLAYALWICEKGRDLRYVGFNKNLRPNKVEYRNFMKDSTFEHFAKDESFLSYVDLAKDMHSEVFEMKTIPLEAQTKKEIILFEKYSSIIRSRKWEKLDYYKGQKYMNNNELFESYRSYIMTLQKSDDEKVGAIRSYSEQMGVFDNKVAIRREIKSLERLEMKSLMGSVNNNSGFSEEVAILKSVESDWMDIQSDIVQLLKYPILSDPGEPLVKDFYEKLSYAQSLSTKTLGNDFLLSISKLKASWEHLLYEARKIELSKFSDGERKKILMATKLMGIALDAASTPSERQSAYRKAMEQLKGLVVIPRKAMQVLEEAVNKMELVA